MRMAVIVSASQAAEPIRCLLKMDLMIFKSLALGLGIFFIGAIAYQVFKVQTLPLPPSPGPNMSIGISLWTENLSSS